MHVQLFSLRDKRLKSFFGPIVWSCILKDRLNISPIRPCLSNLSYSRPILWYCILKDGTNISPIRPCSLNRRILATLDLQYGPVY